VRDVLEQVRSAAPSTHVLFLGARDTPVVDFVTNIDHAIFDEFTQDVLYADKTVSKKTPAFGDDRRLPAWSPHRVEHENFVGESFLVRIAFLLSVLPQLDLDEEWDSWALLRAAKASSGRILKVDETWFSTSPDSPSSEVRPHGPAQPTISAADCSLITLTAGTGDDSRNFPTLIEEHLDAIAQSNASEAEHVLVLGPECPESLRRKIVAKSSSTLKVVEVADRFNFSHRCNIARTVSSGAITVLVNDDFVPSRPDWLERLIEPFSDPMVGITGATLLYADDTVQHIGVGVRNGSFQHLYAGAELSETRVSQLIQMNREVDAVTGACFAIRTELFDAVGGLTEGFPLNFNDVDLCLKVRALGQSVVLVGTPLGYHLESRTRPAVLLPAETLLFINRWPFRSIESDYPFENWA
jgi:GT2 family glycosyltransferase